MVRVIAVVAAFLLGVAGFWQAYAGLGQHPALLKLIMQSVRLIVGNFPAELNDRDLPATLLVARIALPLLTFWTTIALAWQQVRNPLRLRLMRTRGEHLIVAGDSDLAMLAARGELAKGRRVLIWTDNLRAHWVAAAQDGGAAVVDLAGDDSGPIQTGPTQLGLGRSRRVLLLAADDTGNAALAARIMEQTAQERPAGDPLPIITRIDDLELRAGIEERFDRLGQAAARIRFASLPDLGARQLFLNWPLDRLRHHGDTARRVIFLGFSPTVERYIVRMLAGGHFRDGVKARFTILDPAAETWEAAFRRRHPGADALAPVQFITADLAGADQAVRAVQDQRSAQGDPVAIVIDCGEDTRSLAAALAIDELYRRADAGAPLIHVRLASGHDKRLACMVHAFGNLDDFADPDLLVQEEHDGLARSIHDFYLEGRLAEGDRINSRASMREWEDLSESFRDDNRLVADCYQLKLRDIGARLVPGQGTPLRFEPDELEELSRAEHDRWMAAKLSTGWTYAATRDDARRLHPDIVPYDDLSERIKDLDREQIRVMTRLLAATGKRAARLLPVALDPQGGPGIAVGLDGLFTALAAHYPDRVPLFSGLLGGAAAPDALIAAAAAGHLVKLHAAGNIQAVIDALSSADRLAVIDMVRSADALVILPTGTPPRAAVLDGADLLVTSETAQVETAQAAARQIVRIDDAGRIVAAPWLRPAS